MKHATFEQWNEIKNYLNEIKSSVDLKTFGLEKLKLHLLEVKSISIGTKSLSHILLSLGIDTRRVNKEKQEPQVEYVSELKKQILELIAVVNHLNSEMAEIKSHAFASRQYVCELAEQLGVSFEKYNNVLSNGRL